MASGIIQNPQISQGTQPSGAAQVLQQPSFSTNVIRYPEDLGSNSVPSYVIFNIYIPESAVYDKGNQPSSNSTISNSQANQDYESSQLGINDTVTGTKTGAAIGVAMGAAQSGVSAGGGVVAKGGAATGTAVTQGAVATVLLTDGSQIKLTQPLKAIKQSIGIYMPDTVMTSFNHDYGTVSATAAQGNLGLGTAIGESVGAAYNKLHGNWLQEIKQIYQNLGKTPLGIEATGKIAEASGLTGAGFTGLGLRSGGNAINPQIQLLYTGTQFRSFIFEFRFQPRSAKESQTIQNIIQTFKYYSSPSIQKNSNGRYFITPGQFDITFKFGNIDNQFISKISTCVLEAIDLNYAGAGQWTTFTDGSPMEITMQLRFRETDVIYQELMAAPDGSSAGLGY